VLFGHLARMYESADARRMLTRVIGKGQQDVLTLRTTYHDSTTSGWKMPPSWHWTDHYGGYWQQVELSTELMLAEQW